MSESVKKGSNKATPPIRERLKREDPARSAPIRHWSGLFRYQEREQAGDEAGNDREGQPGRFVSDGVKLAYKIADEQIQQGQRIAEQINSRKYDVTAVGNDLRELSERTIRYSMDLTALWFELLGSLPEVLMRLPDDLPNPFRIPRPGDSPRSGAPGAGHKEAARPAEAHWIEVSSRLPAKVTLDLQPGTESRPLGTHGLQTMDGRHAPLGDVSFVRPPAGDPPGVRIRVPEEAAEGLYTGVVFDQETGAAVGTISVRLSGSSS